MVFNHLRRGGYVAKGLFSGSPPHQLARGRLERLSRPALPFAGVPHRTSRLQVQYFCDSDYKSELLRYQQETEGFANVWTKRARNERFARYWQAMTERSSPATGDSLHFARAGECAEGVSDRRGALRLLYDFARPVEVEYEHIHRLLLEIFGSNGARILPMSHVDHFRHYQRFLNPSLNDRLDFDPAEGFSPELSIQENCWHSEGSGQSDLPSMAIIICSLS